MIANDLLTNEAREWGFAIAFNGKVKNLLSIGKDAKTVKSLKVGVLTGIVYMAPANSSGHNVCKGMTRGCKAACLFTAGQGKYPNVKAGRMRRTYQFIYRQDEFMVQLAKEIKALSVKAKKLGLIAAVRLNGTSDIAYENIAIGDYANIFAMFPNVAFYDYTKVYKRLNACATIRNYHLTFSRAETKLSNTQAIRALNNGHPVTVVFRGSLPETWQGYQVIDGDEHDFRVWDSGVVVGLKAKGDAIKDTSGFVVDHVESLIDKMDREILAGL